MRIRLNSNYQDHKPGEVIEVGDELGNGLICAGKADREGRQGATTVKRSEVKKTTPQREPQDEAAKE